MKIALNSFETTLDVQVTGEEPWLERIYKDFSDDRASTSRINGSLLIQRDEAGGAKVRGHLQFTPMVACGRCAQSIALPLAITIDARFLAESENPERADNWKRERNLSRDELDAYYVASGMIDLEEVINDAIHSESPDSYVPASDDGSTCLVCHVDLSSDRVFGEDRDSDSASPFAALKRFKPKH